MSRREIEPLSAHIINNSIELSVVEENLEWGDEDILSLPEGARAQIIYQNSEENRTDMFLKFPQGYREPRHSHKATHAVLILDGKVEIGNTVYTSGDYIFGHEIPHGPMEYLEDTISFGSFVGTDSGGPNHRSE